MMMREIMMMMQLIDMCTYIMVMNGRKGWPLAVPEQQKTESPQAVPREMMR